VIATIALPAGSDPNGIAVSPVGPAAGDIYVANFGNGTVSIIQPPMVAVADAPMQAYGRAQADTCATNAPSWVNWPGIASQQYVSWGMSWQQWPNNGTGGFVCVRQPFYTAAGSWTVR